MTLNELAKAAYKTAKEKGFHDVKRDPATFHMLMVTEISEATEAIRNGEDSFYLDDNGKPDGEAVELADCLIRIADYFELNGWDLEEIVVTKMLYNSTRPQRHGGKKF